MADEGCPPRWLSSLPAAAATSGTAGSCGGTVAGAAPVGPRPPRLAPGGGAGEGMPRSPAGRRRRRPLGAGRARSPGREGPPGSAARRRLPSRPAALLPPPQPPSREPRGLGAPAPSPPPAVPARALRTLVGGAGGPGSLGTSARPSPLTSPVMVNERRLGLGARRTGAGLKGQETKRGAGLGGHPPGEASAERPGPPRPRAVTDKGRADGSVSRAGPGQVARRGEQ